MAYMGENHVCPNRGMKTRCQGGAKCRARGKKGKKTKGGGDVWLQQQLKAQSGEKNWEGKMGSRKKTTGNSGTTSRKSFPEKTRSGG